MLRFFVFDVFYIVIIENHPLNLVIRKQIGELMFTNADLFLVVIFSVGSHFVLEGEKVQHLVKHGQVLTTRILVVLALCVNFKRLESLPELTNL